MLRGLLCSSLVICCLASPLNAVATTTDNNLFQLSLEDLGNLEVSAATGTPKPLRMAPAVASVITADDLKTLGARTIDDALQLVPGLEVSHGGLLYGSRYFFRGIFMNNNPRALVLVNGIPMTSLFLGDRLMGWPGVPVGDVERIEVIRGPGSAVFGADAFAGVINIITKGPDDVKGGNASVSYGSFATGTAHAMQRVKLGQTRTLFSLDYASTNGDDRLVEKDWQSGFDSLFNTHASFAPGHLNLGSKSMDFRFDTMADNGLRLRGYWQSRWDIGTAQGIGDALDPQGQFENRFAGMNLTWQKEMSQVWSLESVLSYDYKHVATTDPAFLLPPGAFGGAFPQGLQLDVLSDEEHVRGDVSVVYTGWQAHRLRIGTGYYWGNLFHSSDQQNFSIDFNGNPVPLAGMTNFSGTSQELVPEAIRSNYHAFVQDEWTFAERWELTSGLRYDHFSDFGEATNPRLALVWNTTPTLTSKLLYGEAFRAPAVTDLYLSNSILGRGDPNLKPERLKSLELAFNYHPNTDWSVDLNLYQYHIYDAIDFMSNPSSTSAIALASNVGEFKGRGVETEVRYQVPNLPLRFLANYSHQDMIDTSTDMSRGQTPLDKAHVHATWGLADRAWLTVGTTWYGQQLRQQGDPRPPLASYAVADMSLRIDKVQNLYSLIFAVHNLFNQDVLEPSNGPANAGAPPRMPYDLPQEGRCLTLTVSTDW